MKQSMHVKFGLPALILAIAVSGCGSDSTPVAPKGAMRPPDPHLPLSTKTVWTLEEKISAVQNSGMSPEQKTKTIADLKAQGK